MAEIMRSAGFITQTRRNILLIRYNKATGNDLKSHKLQQLLDKIFCQRLSRMSLDQLAKKVCEKKLSLGLSKAGARMSNGASGNRRPAKLDMSENDMTDFNPQVHILHLSGSEDEALPLASHKQPKNLQGNSGYKKKLKGLTSVDNDDQVPIASNLGKQILQS